MASIKKGFRLERDTMGEKPVPIDALYGIQTVRARENFPISGTTPKKEFIIATAQVKKAACMANLSLNLIDKKKAYAIMKAAQEIIDGLHHREFIVDVYQAGAGTSHNMNANEVIANRAIVLLLGRKGDYSVVHPNDDVNMSQSTNDTMPTALRLAILSTAPGLIGSLNGLQRALKKKSAEFSRVLKSGRTHLQDAVPVTLGSEFGSYASAVRSSTGSIQDALARIKRIGLGATAVGSGINTHPLYRTKALKALKDTTGFRDLRKAPDYYEALNSMGDFAAFSGALRGASIELIRIANDLRLLSSGPRTGLAEIKLPAVQPGSSIMPGKINPVMPEMLDMVCFQAIGNDLTVAMAAQAGQFELNVMLPVINYNILQSIGILTNALKTFTSRCVEGIKADKARCLEYYERSTGLATVLNRLIGYEKAAHVAREAERTGRTVKEAALGSGVLTEKQWNKLLEQSMKNKKG